MYKKITTVIILGITPYVAVSQGGGNVNTILDTLESFILALIPLAISFGLIFFFWGLALSVLKAGDSAERAKGRNLMVWGLIALFVMFSVWGLVAILQDSAGVDNLNRPETIRINIL